MSSIRLYEPSFFEAWCVAENLRFEDKRELETASGKSAMEAVFSSLAASRYRYVTKVEGASLHSLCGVLEDLLDDDSGIIWMVGTELIEKNKLATYKVAREFINGFLKHYRVLWNYADTRNKLHLKWLQALGASFGPMKEINGQPFVYFEFVRKE